MYLSFVLQLAGERVLEKAATPGWHATTTTSAASPCMPATPSLSSEEAEQNLSSSNFMFYDFYPNDVFFPPPICIELVKFSCCLLICRTIGNITYNSIHIHNRLCHLTTIWHFQKITEWKFPFTEKKKLSHNFLVFVCDVDWQFKSTSCFSDPPSLQKNVFSLCTSAYQLKLQTILTFSLVPDAGELKWTSVSGRMRVTSSGWEVPASLVSPFVWAVFSNSFSVRHVGWVHLGQG